jgi:hypothetical protein
VIDAAEKSRRGSGWLPLSDPRYAAPEYRRVARLSLLGSAAVWIPLYLLSSFSAISAGSAVLYAASLGVVLLIGGLAYVGFGWWLLRRRLWPATQAIAWHNAQAEGAWVALDGGTNPVEADAALDRIGDRHDRLATWLRAAWLARSGRIDELRALVDHWRPSDPVDAARHAIAVSELEYRTNSIDDFSPARAGAEMIADPTERARVLSLIELRDAWRRGDRSEDPFPSLVAARRLLGSEGDVAHDLLVVWRRATLRAALFFAALIGASTAIALVTGIWWMVLAVPLVVTLVRALVRRRHLTRAPA